MHRIELFGNKILTLMIALPSNQDWHSIRRDQMLVIIALLSSAHQLTASEEPRHLAKADVYVYQTKQAQANSPAATSSFSAENHHGPIWNKREELYRLYARGFNARKRLYEEAQKIKAQGDALTPDIKKLEERISELDNQPKSQ